MALNIDASSPAVATTSSYTATSAAFVPPDGSLLVIAFSGNSTGGANPAAPTITDSLGGHLTYTLSNWRSRADGSPSGINGQCALWTAPVGTGVSMTVSVTGALAENALKVWVITGQDPTTPIGVSGENASASASSISQSYTAAATSGQGFGVTCDWDTIGNQSAGTGCTILTGNVASQFNYGFVRRSSDDDSVGVANSINVTLPGASTNLSWCWIEILPTLVNPIAMDPPPFVVCRPLGRFAPNGPLSPWMGAVDAPSQPITMAVKATEGGTTANGMSLAVKMLTGAAAVQTGTSNSTNTITTPSLAITPTATGSWVYGALLDANGSTAWTALAASTPFVVNFSDPTNGSAYGNYRSTSTTTAATPVTLGASAPTGLGTGGLAQAEILSSTGLAEDPASPAPVTTTAATTVTTATFTTVPGSLLVATVCSDGGAGVCTMALTGGGLTWTEVVKANASGKGYAGVWTARVPAAATAATAETGTSTTALTAAGAALKRTAQTGSCVIALTGTAAARKTATGTATAELAARLTATAVKVAPQAGTDRLALIATGAVSTASARAQTGTCAVALTVAGAERKTAPAVGQAGVVLRSTAAVAHGQAGTAELAARATGTATKLVSRTGAAEIAVRSSATAVKVAPQATTARLVLTGTAAETSSVTRQQTGSCVVVLAGSGAARKSVSRTGTSLLAATTTGIARKVAAAAGRAVAALLDTGTAAKRAPAASATQAALTTVGTVSAQAARPQTGITALPLRSAATARKVAPQAARALLATTTTALDVKRATVAGRATLTVTTRPAVTGIDTRPQAGAGRLALATTAVSITTPRYGIDGGTAGTGVDQGAGARLTGADIGQLAVSTIG